MEKSAFLSVWKSNGTVLFTGDSSEKKEYLCAVRTSAMLLDQLSNGDWVNTRFVCGKMHCSIWLKFSPVFPINEKLSFHSILFAEKLHCSIWQKIFTGFSVQMEVLLVSVSGFSRCYEVIFLFEWLESARYNHNRKCWEC